VEPGRQRRTWLDQRLHAARADGHRQWAYDEQPLYTSVLDHQPGDTLGGSDRKEKTDGDAPAVRVPVGPPPQVPAGFLVRTTSSGRLLTTDRNYSVYRYDRDTATASRCTGECATRYSALPAPALARPRGEWGVIERSPGVLQWTFRGHPLYTHAGDTDQWSQEGSDEPGWTNVYTQRAPTPPAGFSVHDTDAGQVLADAHGMTVYVYNCGDDSFDQLACDHPGATQAYRLAVCGGGSVERCLANWRYVRAPPGARSASRAWSILRIDPATGHRAAPGQAGALDVWAYRERPVYTYAGDLVPGDTNGDNTGEWRGYRNGLKAFWLRDDYYMGAL
jgi:predicted lipoprotein with Yx(FWY)xxD motif